MNGVYPCTVKNHILTLYFHGGWNWSESGSKDKKLKTNVIMPVSAFKIYFTHASELIFI